VSSRPCFGSAPDVRAAHATPMACERPGIYGSISAQTCAQRTLPCLCRGGPAWPPSPGQPHRVAPTSAPEKVCQSRLVRFSTSSRSKVDDLVPRLCLETQILGAAEPRLHGIPRRSLGMRKRGLSPPESLVSQALFVSPALARWLRIARVYGIHCFIEF
jgi:hypothetical protein